VVQGYFFIKAKVVSVYRVYGYMGQKTKKMIFSLQVKPSSFFYCIF